MNGGLWIASHCYIVMKHSKSVNVITISANTESDSQVFSEIKNWMMDRPGNEVTLSWIRHLHWSKLEKRGGSEEGNMVCHSTHVCTELLGSREGLSLIPRLSCMGMRLGRGWEWHQAISWLGYNQELLTFMKLSFEAKSEPVIGIGHKGIFYSKNNWIVHFKLLVAWTGTRRTKKEKEDEESIKISDSTTGCTLDGIKTEEQIETFTVVAKPWFQGYKATLNPRHPKVSLQIKT